MAAGQSGQPRRNALETVVLAASGLLVLGAFAVLVREGARERRPAVLVASVDSVVARAGAHHAHVSVRNDGDEAAARARVRGRLRGGATDGAAPEVVVDWVPGRSTARVTLLFAEDPGASGVDVHVVGFAEP